MTMRLLTVALLWLACSATTHAEGPASGSWNFKVLLDDKPIGQQSFTLTKGEGDKRELRSVASFNVKFFGVTVYRYRHQNSEQWAGDCLVGLQSTTDNDGTPLAVKARKEGNQLVVEPAEGGSMALDGCVMSFAYWHPQLLKQTRLLNAQSGVYEKVRVELLGQTKVEAQGKTVDATCYTIFGPGQPIVLSYSAQGDWLRLESAVSDGKRKLTYVRE